MPTSKKKDLFFGELPENIFDGIKSIVYEKSGIDLGNYKDGCIKRRISVRLKVSGCETAENYLKKITVDDVEFQKLLNALTINVTQFFRNPSTFDKVKDIVVPQVLGNKKKSADLSLKIWSAGCSSGEEPYSIAILLKELLKNDPRKITTVIMATDVDAGVIFKGKEAQYDEKQLKNVGQELIEKYFSLENDEKYKVVESVKKMVTFEKRNIMTHEVQKEQDIIFCRNILIYFPRDLQEKILSTLTSALNMGGFLVLGKAETLTSGSRNFFETVCATERIYQKI